MNLKIPFCNVVDSAAAPAPLQRENRRSSFGIRDYNLYRGSYEARGLCRLWVYKDRGGLLWGRGSYARGARERVKEGEKATRWSSVKRFSL